MRYRPFGQAGMPVSAIALTVDDRAGERGPDALARLIFAAMEAGVNAFHIESGEPKLLAAVGRSLAAVERRLLFVSLRLGPRSGLTGPTRDFSPKALTGAIDHALGHTGLGYLDLVLLDEPGEDELPTTALTALKHERTTGRVGLLGVAGAHDAMDAYLGAGAFDVLATPHHPRSGSKELNRVKTAARLEMGVIAYDYFPELFREESTTPGVPRKRSLVDKLTGAPELHPLAGAGTFAFLHSTTNWTPEALCLAYALMEPAVSTVLIRAHELERLEALAAVPDLDPPPGMAAKIEMARFAMEQAASTSGHGGLADAIRRIVAYLDDLNVAETYATLQSKITGVIGDFSGAEAPEVKDAPKNVLQHLSGGPPGHGAHTLSPAPPAPPLPTPNASLRATTAPPNALSGARSDETSGLPRFDATPRPPRPPTPSASRRAKTAPQPNALSGARSGETSGLPQFATPRPPRSPTPSASPRAKTVTPQDALNSAESGETPALPQFDATPPPTAVQPSAAQPQTAIWRSKDYDYPVQPTGESFPGPDGRTYLRVDFNGSLAFVPADEMILPEDTTPPPMDREEDLQELQDMQVLQARVARIAR